MEITAEQLRVAASLEALRDAAVREPETRRVSNSKTVEFGGRTFDLTMVPGAVAGLKVTLQVNAFRSPSIDVLFVDPDTGAESWHVVAPMAVDQWGFREGGPVWGVDKRVASNSAVDDHRNALTKQAYKTGDGLPTLEEAAAARKAHAQAYEGVVDAMAHVRAAQVPTYLPRRSTALELPARTVEARRLSIVEACRLLKEKLGERYTPQVFQILSERFPDGVPEDRIEPLSAELVPEVRTDGAPVLRIAGGDS